MFLLTILRLTFTLITNVVREEHNISFVHTLLRLLCCTTCLFRITAALAKELFAFTLRTDTVQLEA